MCVKPGLSTFTRWPGDAIHMATSRSGVTLPKATFSPTPRARHAVRIGRSGWCDRAPTRDSEIAQRSA
jgi:hypothetical protein